MDEVETGRRGQKTETGGDAEPPQVVLGVVENVQTKGDRGDEGDGLKKNGPNLGVVPERWFGRRDGNDRSRRQRGGARLGCRVGFLDGFSFLWLMLLAYMTVQPLWAETRSLTTFYREWFFFASLWMVYVLASLLADKKVLRATVLPQLA